MFFLEHPICTATRRSDRTHGCVIPYRIPGRCAHGDKRRCRPHGFHFWPIRLPARSALFHSAGWRAALQWATTFHAAVAQSVRAPRCQRGGRVCDSLLPHQFSRVGSRSSERSGLLSLRAHGSTGGASPSRRTNFSCTSREPLNPAVRKTASMPGETPGTCSTLYFWGTWQI